MRKERETKVRISGALLIATRTAASITEINDAVKAIWRALPPKYRGRDVTIQSKVKRIVNNWDHLDVEQAVTNLIVDQVTDRIYGGLRGRASRAMIRSQLFSSIRIPNGRVCIKN